MRDVNMILGTMRLKGAGVADSAINKLFGMDSKDLGNLISGKSEEGKDYITTFIEKGMSGINKMIDHVGDSSKDIKESLAADKKQTGGTSGNNTQEHIHTVKSDVTLGAYQRQLQSNPQYWADLMKSSSRSYTPSN